MPYLSTTGSDALKAEISRNNGRQKKSKAKSSISVFRDFIDYCVQMDASKVFTKECFDAWLSSRVTVPKQPEESFRRALTAHLRGSDGRSPFSEEEEAAVLKLIRNKNVFAGMFKNSNGKGNGIGNIGFRGLGYHEKLRNGHKYIHLSILPT